MLPSLSTYFKVAGPIFLVLDFVTPFMQSLIGGAAHVVPAVTYFAIGAIILLSPKPVCQKLVPEANDETLRAFKQFGMFMLATSLAWFLLSQSAAGEKAREDGLIVSLFPELSEFQDRLFGELGVIRQGVERTAEGVDTLVGFAEEERSDPAFQLERRGITRNEDAFWEAVSLEDVETVRLFLESGWRVRAHRLEYFLIGDVFGGRVAREFWTPEIAELFLDHQDLMDDAICKPTFNDIYPASDGRQESVSGVFFTRLTEEAGPRIFWANLCGRDELIAYLSGFRDSETSRAAQKDQDKNHGVRNFAPELQNLLDTF
jgi:hypothetical protein